MSVKHSMELIVQLLRYLRQGAEPPTAVCQKMSQAVGNRLFPSKHPREGFLVILLLCAVQCLIPIFLAATALAEDAAAPYHGPDSVKGAQKRIGREP
jgi:hypothetical protein